MGDIRNEGALHLVQAVLLFPVNEDAGSPGKNQGQKNTAFGQGKPSEPVNLGLSA